MTTEQKPLNSGFGAKTTAKEVLAGRDLTGKLAIVTGGYSGVGLETTRALAEAGATVVVPARTQEKARTALAGIRFVQPGYCPAVVYRRKHGQEAYQSYLWQTRREQPHPGHRPRAETCPPVIPCHFCSKAYHLNTT